MGLDVYVYHCKDRKAAVAQEAAAEAAVELIWVKPYDELTEEDRKALSEQSNNIRAKFDCDEYGGHSSVTELRQDSKQFPEHYFKVGYFRSSYNSGGINRVMDRLGLPTLDEIMGAGEEYEFTPDWAVCLQNVDEAIADYQAHLNSTIGQYDVMEMSSHLSKVDSPMEALKIFEKEINEKKGGFTSYSNIHGDFFLDGVKIHAVIPSSDKFCPTYVIYKKEHKMEEDFYLQALQIVRETCEYVLSQPDPENYYVHWSS